MTDAHAPRIRRARPDDAAAMETTLATAFEPLRAQYTPAGFAATTPSADVLAARFAEGPAWVAVLDDLIVGTVAARTTAGGVYVRSMAVLPGARGSGVGQALLDQVEAFANAQGAPRLYLSTTPFLDAAIRLYVRAGFVRTDEGPTDLHGTPLLTMEKPL